VTVRPGGDADAPAAARLHAGRITQGFLSFLGPGFLARLYRRVGRTPDSFLLVADDGGTVVGFIAGSADVGGLYRSFLVRDGVVAGLAAAPRLVRSWRRVAETLRHGAGGADGTGRGTELLAVAVDPAAGGRGVGTALVAAFLDEVTASGGDEAYVVVGADNAPAVRLYAAAGFVAAGEFELHAGTRSLVMQWSRGRR
jgi:ribosomal protein S18 acetylase RimI-like enzyme